MQAGRAGAGERIDVLIVTALREEYAAVRAVNTGALPGSTWEARTASTGLELRVRPSAMEPGPPVHLALRAPSFARRLMIGIAPKRPWR
jgi:hypothetical protein